MGPEQGVRHPSLIHVSVLQGVPLVVPKDMGTGVRAYDNSSPRSMSLLLLMISSRLNMSLLAFIDTV